LAAAGGGLSDHGLRIVAIPPAFLAGAHMAFEPRTVADLPDGWAHLSQAEAVAMLKTAPLQSRIAPKPAQNADMAACAAVEAGEPASAREMGLKAAMGRNHG
jgi:hypothetical protein